MYTRVLTKLEDYCNQYMEPEHVKVKGAGRLGFGRADSHICKTLKGVFRMENRRTQGTSQFLSLDLGTGVPSSVPMERVEVRISAENLLGEYARAFVNECYNIAPLRAKGVKLTQGEVMKYCEFLLQRRIAFVNESITDSRRLKVLAIPPFIQFCLSNVGKVRKTDRGLTMVPVFEAEVISFEEALVISEKIAAFERDMTVLFDAMPRSIEGNSEVMSTALIADYVRAMEKVTPVSSYVSAFLGLKLVQENVYASLYRVVYDDIEFIRSALPNMVVKC